MTSTTALSHNKKPYTFFVASSTKKNSLSFQPESFGRNKIDAHITFLLCMKNINFMKITTKHVNILEERY